MKTVYDKTGNQASLVENTDISPINAMIDAETCPYGTNANDIKATGIYRLLQDYGVTNIPVDANGILLAFIQTNQFVVQFYFHYDGTAWSRTCWGNNWYDWKHLT